MGPDLITSRWASPLVAFSPGSTDAQALSALASDSPARGPEWLRAWYGAFGDIERDPVLLVEDEGRLVGALALTRTSRLGGSLRLLSSTTNGHSQYAALLIDRASPGPVADALIEALVARTDWDMLRLQGLDAGDAALLEERALARKLAVDLEHIFANHVLRLSSASEGRAKTAKRLERQLRSLRQAGAVTIDVASGPSALAALSEYTAAESRSWKAAGGELLASGPAILAFYRALADGADLHVHLLRVDGVVIAGLCTIPTGGGVVALKVFFDADFAKYSPGTILLHRLSADAAIDPAVGSVDFHSSREAYRPLSNDVRVSLDLTLWSRTLRARAGRFVRAVRRSLAGRG